MSMQEPPGRMVKVDWVDSCDYGSWTTRAKLETDLDEHTLVCHTVGYLWKETDRYICVVGTWDENHPNLSDINQIPRSAVVRIRDLQ